MKPDVKTDEPKEKRISDEVAAQLRIEADGEEELKGGAGGPRDEAEYQRRADLYRRAADLLQATPPDGRIGEEQVTRAVQERIDYLRSEAKLSRELGLQVANAEAIRDYRKQADAYEWAANQFEAALTSTQPSDGRISVELTEAEIERLTDFFSDRPLSDEDRKIEDKLFAVLGRKQ